MAKAPTDRNRPAPTSPSINPGDVFQRVVHAANVAYYVWIPDTGELHASPGLLSLFGLDHANWSSQAFLDAVHPDDVGPYRAALRSHFKSNADRMELTCRLQVPGGTYKWARELSTLERDSTGRVTRVTATITDITEAKQREADLQAALDQQTAMSEILQVITASPGNLTPLFQSVLNWAVRLTSAEYGDLYVYDGERFTLAAQHNAPPVYLEYRRLHPLGSSPGSISRRVLDGEDVIHIADIRAEDIYRRGDASRRAAADLAGMRTVLAITMRKDTAPLGVLNIYRTEVNPFSQQQIALLQSFAAQAVIAMENARLLTEQREALERQTATADILAVINASPGELMPVFDTILEQSLRLTDSTLGAISTWDGEFFHTMTSRGYPQEVNEAWQPIPARAGTLMHRLVQGEDVATLADVREDEAYRSRVPSRVWFVEQAGARSQLAVALRKEGTLLGYINIFRTEVKPFTDEQIALLQSFAAQAVVAMENARLLTELRQRTVDLQESLDYQTAISAVLRTISEAAEDPQPVFETIVTHAARLCDANLANVTRLEGEHCRAVATASTFPEFASVRDQTFALDRRSVAGRAVTGRATVQIEDLPADPDYGMAEILRRMGVRTALGVPLLRDGIPIGTIGLGRTRKELFTEKQIALVQTFADQAVIALENARLLSELRERTDALAERNSQFGERIDQQNATIDVLKVMSTSPGDPQPVFDLIADRARTFAQADAASVITLDGAMLSLQAYSGQFHDITNTYRTTFPRPVGADSAVGRAVLTGGVVLIDDTETDQEYGLARTSATIGLRAVVAVPMLRAGKPIGAVTLARRTPGRFSEAQSELLRTFAEQAVIAITSAENHRALQQRTAELDLSLAEQREALEQQKASAEILNVISTSVSDPQPVFEKILQSCKLLFGGDEMDVLLVDDQGQLQVASYLGNAVDVVLPTFPAPWEKTPAAAAIRDLRVAHYPDVLNDPAAPRVLRRLGEIAGFHSMAFAPLVWEGRGIGVVGVARARGPFSDRDLEIMQGFADQAVIAIQNARMFREIREARDTAESTLTDLRRAQDRLVQSEKMASLGQLTAGIAHEIKNPLNFVNNFSDLSADLLDELNEILGPVEQGVDPKLREEIEDLTTTLKSNLAKIAEHGRRADSIVKNMLAHSRSGASERRFVDLNATAEEALNLAYHGARAEFPGFNIALEKDLDPETGLVELSPQEFTRVLVNLINNGFYAARKRHAQEGSGFEPALRLGTRNLGDHVEIRVRDNGTGIPAAAREKIFEPFFTTKPAGEGTGLGLSLSYDIIVKQHGGQLNVESVPGSFTEFTITLPRQMPANAGGQA